MSAQGLVEVRQHRPALQPTRLHHRQHPLHEPTPGRAGAAEGVLPPQHPAAQHPLGMMVRRLDPLGHHEPPDGRQQRQHVGAARRRFASGAPAPRLEHTLEGTRGAVQPRSRRRPTTGPVGQRGTWPCWAGCLMRRSHAGRAGPGTPCGRGGRSWASPTRRRGQSLPRRPPLAHARGNDPWVRIGRGRPAG